MRTFFVSNQAWFAFRSFVTTLLSKSASQQIFYLS